MDREAWRAAIHGVANPHAHTHVPICTHGHLFAFIPIEGAATISGAIVLMPLANLV